VCYPPPKKKKMGRFQGRKGFRGFLCDSVEIESSTEVPGMGLGWGWAAWASGVLGLGVMLRAECGSGEGVKLAGVGLRSLCCWRVWERCVGGVWCGAPCCIKMTLVGITAA